MIAYWKNFGRIDQFVMGAFFLYVYRTAPSKLTARMAGIALVLCALIFLAFWYWFNLKGGWMNYGKYPSPAHIWIALQTIEGMFYGLFIALYLCISQNFNDRIARLISYVGTISYSIYLSNCFVIPLLENLHSKIPFTHTTGFGKYFGWGLLIGFPVISALTYSFIERPFLERRKPYIYA